MPEHGRDGAYILRGTLRANDPAVLWQRCMLRTEIEAAFKCLQSELAIRPVHHQLIILDLLGLSLPAQPPPRIRGTDLDGRNIGTPDLSPSQSPPPRQPMLPL